MSTSKESFNIPLRDSSAWDWNLGPGYGAGYGTGYAMWGIWPGNLPGEPWKNWMWARRPLIFRTPFTPVPQIDYNNGSTNHTVRIISDGVKPRLAINGTIEKTLQLDRHRTYYFNIHVPGSSFMITDGVNQLIDPVSEGTFTLNFTNNDPDKLYYSDANGDSVGIIYLNSTRWE